MDSLGHLRTVKNPHEDHKDRAGSPLSFRPCVHIKIVEVQDYWVHSMFYLQSSPENSRYSINIYQT